MKLWFLPFVREGMRPAAAPAGARARAAVELKLVGPGGPGDLPPVEFELAGPGDVLAIDAGQVLRVTPAAAARDAEPEFFPAVEFDAPDLPWAYSPSVPAGARLQPWICLVVVEDQPGVRVDPGERGQSPWVLRLPADVARRELPDLADAWAWAHAQVACDTETQIADTLARYPDRTLSRLLAPRRLLPRRRYHACVVPTFRAGRLAGLGTPGSAPAGPANAPAWSAADLPAELPAYHAWSFRTGEAGDFESLARRMRPAPLDPGTPSTPLELELPRGGGTVDWRPPLRIPGSVPAREPRPAAAVEQIRDALAGAGAAPPVLGPPYLGGSWLQERRLDAPSSWAPELNLTPMWRAAAGLGADVVREEQESLVAAAAEQLEAYRRTQAEAQRKQAAAVVGNRLKLRVDRTPPAVKARLLGPLATRAQKSAADVGLFGLAGRRLARKAWRAQPAAAVPPGPVRLTPVDPGGAAIPIGTVGTVGTIGAIGAIGPIPAVSLSLGGLVAGDLTAAASTLMARELGVGERVLVDPIDVSVVKAEMRYAPTQVRRPVEVQALALVPPVDPTAIADGKFAPRFERPMIEPAAARSPELMLPALEAIPSESAMLVESDPAFIEAFLVGANEELNRELLWRGLPADRRATAFRRFWGGGGDDIAEIAGWSPDSALGSHVRQGAMLVLLFRGELVRRYPSLFLAAVPARWNPDSTRSPLPASGGGSGLELPRFRGRIGEDVMYAGFARPATLAEAIGATANTGPVGANAAPAGWFLLLGENPGDPRFGLDPEGSGPPTRATLSWAHLSLEAGAAYARPGAFPSVADVGFTAAAATASTLARLTRQRPFRAFLHASLLVRPRSTP